MIVRRPEQRSRGLALTGVLFPVKVVLLIPHLVILSVLNFAQFVVAYICYFAAPPAGPPVVPPPPPTA